MSHTKFTAFTTTTDTAKFNAIVRELRAKAQAFQDSCGYPTKRFKKISQPITVPGKGIGLEITFTVKKA
jgi:hypothetical protein